MTIQIHQCWVTMHICQTTKLA